MSNSAHNQFSVAGAKRIGAGKQTAGNPGKKRNGTK